MNVDFRCMIIALHFSGCGTIKFLSHHSWSSARALFTVFVRKSIVSAIQYIVVSSSYRYLSAERSAFGRSFVKSKNKSVRGLISLRHSVSCNVCIGVASVDSDGLTSFSEVVL